MATIIVCPNCGHHFNRPLVTERKLGWGLSALLLALYKRLYMKVGSIRCPACGQKASWGSFKEYMDLPAVASNEVIGTRSQTSSRAGEAVSGKQEDTTKSLDDTKYEQ